MPEQVELQPTSNQPDELLAIERKQAFVSLLKDEYPNIHRVCDKLKVARTKYYQWLSQDKEFANRVDEIKQRQLDEIEASVKRVSLKDSVPAGWLGLEVLKRQRKSEFGDDIRQFVNNGVINVGLAAPEQIDAVEAEFEEVLSRDGGESALSRIGENKLKSQVEG